jgi:hypothetical protein
MGPPSKWAYLDASHLTRSHDHNVVVWVVQVIADVIPIIDLHNDGVL